MNSFLNVFQRKQHLVPCSPLPTIGLAAGAVLRSSLERGGLGKPLLGEMSAPRPSLSGPFPAAGGVRCKQCTLLRECTQFEYLEMGLPSDGGRKHRELCSWSVLLVGRGNNQHREVIMAECKI